MSSRRPWPLEVREAVLRLVHEGWTIRDAARAHGVPYQTAHGWIWDPNGAKTFARKRSYDMECVNCGGWVSGSEGHRDEPWCFRCAVERNAEASRVWDEETIVDSILEWADRYGEPPAGPDWSPWDARVRLGDESRARRFEDARGRWPHLQSAIRVFGSWNAAIAAAGFAPRAANGGGGNAERRRGFKEAA